MARLTPDHRWHWSVEPPFPFLANQTTVSDELLRACRTLYGNGPAYLIPLPGGPEEGYLVVVASGQFPTSSFREQVAYGLARAPYSDVRRALWALIADGRNPYREVSPTRWQLHDGTQVDFTGPTIVGDRTLHEVVADGFYAAKEAHFFQEANLASLGPVTREPVGRLLGNGTMVITHPVVENFAVTHGVLDLLKPMPVVFLPAVQRILGLWGVAAEGEKLSLFRMEMPPLTTPVFDTVTSTPVPPGVDAARALRAYRNFRGPAQTPQPQAATPPTPPQDPRLAGGYVQPTVDLTQTPQPATGNPQPTTPHIVPIPPAPAPAQPVVPMDTTTPTPQATPTQPQWAQTNTPSAPAMPASFPEPAPAPVEGTMQLPPVEETRQIPLTGLSPLPPAAPTQTGVPAAAPVEQSTPAEPTVQLPPAEETRQILLNGDYPARPGAPAPQATTTPAEVPVAQPATPNAAGQASPATPPIPTLTPTPTPTEAPAAPAKQSDQAETTSTASVPKATPKAQDLPPFRGTNPLPNSIGMATAVGATDALHAPTPEVPAAVPVEPAALPEAEPTVQLSSLAQDWQDQTPTDLSKPEALVVRESQPANALVGIDPQPASEDILAPADIPAEESPAELTVQLPSMAKTQEIRRPVGMDNEDQAEAATIPTSPAVDPTVPAVTALRMAPTTAAPQAPISSEADAPAQPPVSAPAFVNQAIKAESESLSSLEDSTTEAAPAQPEVELPSTAKTEFIPKYQEKAVSPAPEEAASESEVSPESVITPMVTSNPVVAEAAQGSVEAQPAPQVDGSLPAANEPVETPAEPEVELPSMAQTQYIRKLADVAKPVIPAVKHINPFVDPLPQPTPQAPAFPSVAPEPQAIAQPEPSAPTFPAADVAEIPQVEPTVDLPSMAQTQHIYKLGEVAEPVVRAVKHDNPFLNPVLQPEAPSPAPADSPADESPVLPSVEITHHIPVQRDPGPEET